MAEAAAQPTPTPAPRVAGDRWVRRMITPEGVPINLRLGDHGDRAAAFMIDFTILIVAQALLMVLLVVASDGWPRAGIMTSFVIISWFALRVFYFPFFELRWRGATPGKRALRLRVASRDGSALRADAVLARNLMREVEVFVPVTLLLVPSVRPAETLVILAMIIWVGILTLMPVFNRDALRVGDMVAGTWVVTVPRTVLMPDLAETQATAQTPADAFGPGFAFSDRQLDIYGIYELQVLEDALRKPPSDPADRTLEEIARRVRRKIDWDDQQDAAAAGDADANARPFLEAFYAALRARLEHRMLLGKRRERKDA